MRQSPSEPVREGGKSNHAINQTKVTERWFYVLCRVFFSGIEVAEDLSQEDTRLGNGAHGSFPWSSRNDALRSAP